MSKKELISEMSEITGLNKKEAEKVIVGLVQIVQAELSENGDCMIPGLGKLEVSQRSERMGINPCTFFHSKTNNLQ